MAFTVDQILKATGAYSCESIAPAAVWALIGGTVDIDGGTLAGVEIDGALTASGAPNIATAAAPLGGVAASGIYSVGAQNLPNGVDCVGTYFIGGVGYVYSGDPAGGAPGPGDYKPLALVGAVISLNSSSSITVAGTIGPGGDADLLTLSANLLTIAGSLLVADAGNIGCASDTDLLALSANTLTVNGDIVIDPSGTIGIDTDVDILTLTNAQVVVAGSLELAVASGSDCDFVMRDGDVAHGMTDFNSTDTFAWLRVLHSTNGGARLEGLSASAATSGLYLGGYMSTASTSNPCVKVVGAKQGGTGIGAPSSAALILQVLSYTTSIFECYGNNIVAPVGAMTLGVDDTTQGHVDVNAGSTGKHAYIMLQDEDGGKWYFFVTNAGQLRFHNVVPTADGDGSAV